jgi:DtxR family Mn-dependent transcriptional regulator
MKLGIPNLVFMIGQSREDYLRAIYNFWEQKYEPIRSIDIVQYLKVSKASVSEMLKKLAKQGYIRIKPYFGISFTIKGLKEAKKLTRKHRVMEVFLNDILKISKRNIHNEAHKLEHCVSDEVIKKLAKFLNNPKYNPQGKKIPKI